jgi:hypothetical protein
MLNPNDSRRRLFERELAWRVPEGRYNAPAGECHCGHDLDIESGHCTECPVECRQCER